VPSLTREERHAAATAPLFNRGRLVSAFHRRNVVNATKIVYYFLITLKKTIVVGLQT